MCESSQILYEKEEPPFGRLSRFVSGPRGHASAARACSSAGGAHGAAARACAPAIAHGGSSVVRACRCAVSVGGGANNIGVGQAAKVLRKQRQREEFILSETLS